MPQHPWAAYPPVVKDVALSPPATSSIREPVMLMHTLMKSAINGPLKNGDSIPARAALAAIGAKADEFKKNALALPLAKFLRARREGVLGDAWHLR